MPGWLAAVEDFCGKAGGIFAGALALEAVTATLLVVHRIDAATWQTATLALWGTVVGGGAISSFRKQ